jgi:hypothetical protein
VTKDEYAAIEARKRDAVVEAAMNWHAQQYATGGSPIHLSMANVSLVDAVNDLRSTLMDGARFEQYGWETK